MDTGADVDCKLVRQRKQGHVWGQAEGQRHISRLIMVNKSTTKKGAATNQIQKVAYVLNMATTKLINLQKHKKTRGAGPVMNWQRPKGTNASIRKKG